MTGIWTGILGKPTSTNVVVFVIIGFDFFCFLEADWR